ncbi:MAG: 50S ribosomal protein L21 [Candidatus Portnoybacteria bacterium CG10_big_fil_rev_8_21_14_0_10_44_7]|uniref:Large ribosomal subunit protein bL21 n=1 Tax=Candidatus Portnoybacteria bacterium CG10_big_fil_rev_8_21_14_0_10_44_7 TaxID=1974816 RepID=A0A2M8KIA4_9BACT|nr:MAG: 50S ribosomal protein L21 [Candidatus Portnoybacteria bacterium CG10_big_fil_rev_8_21_14_0_10_44_7]
MFAIIKTGGKQYKVATGDKIKIEKLTAKEGKPVVFKDVLLIAKGEETKIGQPKVAGAKVESKVLRTQKGKKVQMIKYKAKKRYSVKKGHRQLFTEVEILKITA